MIAKSDAASIFRDTRGSRSIEISVPGAFTAVEFSGQQKKPGASAAERGRPSLFKTIDEDRRERHDHINRSGRSTYPGRISVLTSGATPERRPAQSEGGTVRYIMMLPSATADSTYARLETSYRQYGSAELRRRHWAWRHGGPIINDVL